MPVTNYVWDPLSDNVLLETDENDVTQAVYTQEPDTFGHLISQRRDDETSWYQFDGLGSTRELTNASETVTDTNMYDAWGVNVASTGTTENPFRWVGESGYYDDPETGDYYVRARMYRPAIARWASVDPIEVAFAERFNMYWYAYNQPSSTPDPSGLIVVDKNQVLSQATTLPAPQCPTIDLDVSYLKKKTLFKYSGSTERMRVAAAVERRQAGTDLRVGLGFVQRVTINVTIMIGSCRGLTARSCKQTNLECDEYILHYRSTFLESFGLAGVAASTAFLPDNHSLQTYGTYFTKLKQACNIPGDFSPCCPWLFDYEVVKQVTGWMSPAGNRAAHLTAAADVVCGDGRFRPVANPGDPHTLPPMSDKPHHIEFPSSPVTNVLESTMRLRLSHDRCQRGIGFARSWTGYQEQ